MRFPVDARMANITSSLPVMGVRARGASKCYGMNVSIHATSLQHSVLPDHCLAELRIPCPKMTLLLNRETLHRLSVHFQSSTSASFLGDRSLVFGVRWPRPFLRFQRLLHFPRRPSSRNCGDSLHPFFRRESPDETR